MQPKKLFYLFVISGVILSSCQIFQPDINIAVPTPQYTPTIKLTPSSEIIDPTPGDAAVESNETIEVSPTNLAESPITRRAGFPIAIPRTKHTATLLNNGKILLAGGSVEPDDFVFDEELVDPITGSITWTAPLHTIRHDHSATLLTDGRVLVIGGYSLPQQWLDNAEIYDPVSDTWTVTLPLFSHGTVHTATLMKDGRVLVVGGCTGSGVCTEKVEIFDPKANIWIEAMPLKSDRELHTAQLLDDGRVLIAGGSTANGEIPLDGTAVIYDPRTNSWSTTAPMKFPRYGSKSVKLSNWDVLVAGGVIFESSPPQISNAVEVYEPDTNTWHMVSSLAQPRFAFILSTLPNGQVIAVTGSRDWDCCWTEGSFVREIELYDPLADQWRIIGDFPEPRAFSTGTQLSDGQIWISGGQVENWVLENTWFIHVPNP